MNNVYSWIRDSMYAFCKKFAADMASAYPDNPPIGIYNFDAFSEDNTLPLSDFVGLRGMTVNMRSELATMSCWVGLSTNDDENLFRLEELSGKLLNRLLPKQKLPIYQSGSDGTQIFGYLTLSDGTTVSPVARALQRPLKYIAIKGGISLPLPHE